MTKMGNTGSLACLAAVVLFVASGWSAVAQGAGAAPAFERLLLGTLGGRASVALDRHVYEHARADLGDLRIVDARGEAVPYVLDRAVSESRERAQPTLRNRGYARKQSATVTLDFGRPLLKRELQLSLSGDNFRRRVTVEGGATGQDWTTLTDAAYVFAVPGSRPARYETVPLPENDFPLLRLTIHHGQGDPETIEIHDAWTYGAQRRGARIAVASSFERAEDARTRETLLTLDVGARYQPFDEITLAVSDPRFFREAVLEARREPPPARPGDVRPAETWVYLAQVALYRYDEGGRNRESLRIEHAGRERTLRIRIRNRDDQPLGVQSVSVVARAERVVFEARSDRAYRLTYGAAQLGAPTYDLARTVSDVRAFADAATVMRLDEPKAAPTPRAPWTERHPALLWIGLLLVVATLGWLTFQATRQAG